MSGSYRASENGPTRRFFPLRGESTSFLAIPNKDHYYQHSSSRRVVVCHDEFSGLSPDFFIIRFFFFFSSRRRHTRFSRDWGSDVCSSDLARKPRTHPVVEALELRGG